MKITKGATKALLTMGLAASLAACDSPPQDSNNKEEKQSMQQTATDPYLWLEEVQGEKALKWVGEQNKSSLKRLEGDKRFQAQMDRSLEIYNAKDKIAYGSISGGSVHNTWRDATYVRGLWRKTSLESYNNGTENWETVLDFDALAKAEDENWVYKGRTCLHGTNRCLISLSRGGSDAVVVREFDTKSKTFISDGFITPESKQNVAWVDDNTVLVATDFGEGTMNESGYARQVRLWKRGTDLLSAEKVYDSPMTDVFAFPLASHREDGTYVGVIQGPTFFTRAYHLMDGDKLVKLDLSLDADMTGFFGDQIILTMRKDWSTGGKIAKAGTLVSIKVADAMAGKSADSLTTIYAPENGVSIGGTSIGKNRILINLLDNVKGKLIALNNTDSGWQEQAIDLPENGTVAINSNDDWSDDAFINFESFLQPDTVYHMDNAGTVKAVKSLPARFDASKFTSEQKFATSKDGTKIPYFIVKAKDTELNGKNPTLQYGYGGFEIALTPSYMTGLNLQWLEAGGVYVLANIRGGGEYGPKWHQAVLKENRQGAFDDFIAVSEDLINSGLTSPKHLAVRGGSNGGLLMGAMMTQRPDLYNAIICAVPLLDMMRYHKLLAGASWVGEYGNPDIAAERDYIMKYSPYQNLDAGKDYPEVFFYTSTKDDRVHPGHARKMAAKMLGMGKPVLYYENTEGGHAAASNLKQRAYTNALQMTYLMQKLMDE